MNTFYVKPVNFQSNASIDFSFLRPTLLSSGIDASDCMIGFFNFSRHNLLSTVTEMDGGRRRIDRFPQKYKKKKLSTRNRNR